MPAVDPRVHVDHVALRVSDVARSSAFYALVGGLEIREADPDHAALGAPAGGPPILHLRRAPDPSRRTFRATGLFHTALLFEGRAGLGAALARLAEARIPLSGASDHGVSEALYFDDPDGNGVEIYCDSPPERWTYAAGGVLNVGMNEPFDPDILLTELDPR